MKTNSKIEAALEELRRKEKARMDGMKDFYSPELRASIEAEVMAEAEGLLKVVEKAELIGGDGNAGMNNQIRSSSGR